MLKHFPSPTPLPKAAPEGPASAAGPGTDSPRAAAPQLGSRSCCADSRRKLPSLGAHIAGPFLSPSPSFYRGAPPSFAGKQWGPRDNTWKTLIAILCKRAVCCSAGGHLEFCRLRFLWCSLLCLKVKFLPRFRIRICVINKTILVVLLR